MVLDRIGGVGAEPPRSRSPQASSRTQAAIHQTSGGFTPDVLPVSGDFQVRLAGVASRIEDLLHRLSGLQGRARAGSDLLTRIEQNLSPHETSRLREEVEVLGVSGASIAELRAFVDGTTAEVRTLERALSAEQVAFQNIVSTGGEIQSLAKASLPPSQAVDLDRRTVLELLEP